MAIDHNAVAPEMRQHISATLARVAAEEGVRILFAAESGSRAWGFASPDSDYDVRFIYAHPRDWYLTLTEERDVVERPLDARLVDLAGWDLRKALRLLLKSNPAFYEWLTSPIVYGHAGPFWQDAKALFEAHARPGVLAAAYHSIALRQWKSEIAGRQDIKLKRYFYAIRPLLSLQWVTERGTMPPMNLQALMAECTTPDGVRQEISSLIDSKRTTPELGAAPRIAVVDRWIEERLASLSPAGHPFPERDVSATEREANALFARIAGF